MSNISISIQPSYPSLSFSDSDLNSAYDKLKEKPGIGFPGFSREHVPDYSGAPRFFSNTANFDSIDLLPQTSGLKGDTLDPYDLSKYVSETEPETLQPFVDSRFYYNANIDLIENPDPKTKNTTPLIAPQQAIFDKKKSVTKIVPYKIRFSNRLQQSFYIFVEVDMSLSIRAKCGDTAGTVQFPAFMKTDKKPYDSIFFVYQPPKIRPWNTVTVRSKITLKDQDNLSDLPLLSPIELKTGWKLVSQDIKFITLINTINSSITSARNDNVNPSLGAWDFSCSDLTDTVIKTTNAQKTDIIQNNPVEIISSHPSLDNKIVITTSSEIPQDWSLIRIVDHTLPRSRTIWAISQGVEVNGNFEYTLEGSRWPTNNKGAPFANGRNGIVQRHLGDSTLFPDLDSIEFNNLLNKNLRNVLEARITYLQQNNNLLIEAQQMLDELNKKSNPTTAQENEKKQIRRFINAYKSNSCQKQITLLNFDINNQASGMFLGDVDEIILKYESIDDREKIFIINIDPNGIEYTINNYCNLLKQ